MIDAHCHVDLYPDPLMEAKRAEAIGDVVIAVTNLPSHYALGKPHLAGMKRVRLALGLHPLMIAEHEGEVELFTKLAPSTNYIGEVGLDFSREGIKTRDIQLVAFKKVIESIQGRKKFISIHSRGAEPEVLELLEQSKISGAVFHWFSGRLEVLGQIASA